MRIDQQPAYILHHRPFRETSLILDFFSRDHGRIHAVARGVRKAKSRWRGVLQPFSQIVISAQGRGELLTLTLAEITGVPYALSGDALAGGFYFNELMVRFLEREDAHPVLFDAYDAAMKTLSDSGMQERTLRLFEKTLLMELGYGLALTQVENPHTPIERDAWYEFYPDQGLIRCEGPESPGNVFAGSSLQSFAEDSLLDPQSLQDAKRLMRLALASLPGAKPFQSRRLLVREVKKV
jgi:DNA repair protein RecO (recombination protein O)